MANMGLEGIVELAKRIQHEQTQQVIQKRLSMACMPEETCHAALQGDVDPVLAPLGSTVGSLLFNVLGGDTDSPETNYEILLLRAILIMVGVLLALNISYYVIRAIVLIAKTLPVTQDAMYVHPQAHAAADVDGSIPVPDSVMYNNPPLIDLPEDKSRMYSNKNIPPFWYSRCADAHPEMEQYLCENSEAEENDDREWDLVQADDPELDNDKDEPGRRPESPESRPISPHRQLPPIVWPKELEDASAVHTSDIVAMCVLMQKTRNAYKPPEGVELSWDTLDMDGYGVIVRVNFVFDRVAKRYLDPPPNRLCHITVSRTFWESITDSEKGIRITGLVNPQTYYIYHLEKYASPAPSSHNSSSGEDDVEEECAPHK